MRIMSNNFISNSEIENTLKFISDNYSKLAILPSFLGVVFVWLYLGNIGKLEIFSQMSFSSHGIIAIVLFFLFLYFYLNLPSFILRILLTKDYEFRDFVQSNQVLYVIIQPIIILFFLGWLLRPSSDVSEGNEYKYFYYLVVILFILILWCLYSFKKSKFNERKKAILSSSFLYILISPFFILPLYIVAEASGGVDIVFFLLISIYLSFLMLICFGAIYGFKLNEYLFFLSIVYIALFISLSSIGDGFRLQRIILRPIGIAQNPSESGWYMVKNRDILDLVKKDYLIKYNKNIDDRENYYINGYLIFNVGNARIICPHDFEAIDNNKLNDQKLDFSRCLSLTSEDIQFTGEKSSL